MKRPEGTTAKGTITLGFIFKGGIILAVDSRITNLYGDVIISDNQQKYFELSSVRPIICTFTGSVNDWYSMYEDLRKKEPKTVNEASVLAEDYLVKYAEKYRVLFSKHKKEYGECVTFGTLIAGYDEKEGYQLYSVSLDDNNKPSRKKLNLAILGTGGELAKEVFHHKRRYGKRRKLSIHYASQLAYTALLNATCLDKSAGGTLHVLHLDQNNLTIAHSSVLDVNYFYYGSLSVDKRSLFLLYSKKIDPITKDGDLRKLIKSIWPGGEVKLGVYDLQTAHLVEQSEEGCCFHRLVFCNNWMASNAYNCIPLNQNTGTSPYLEDLVAKENFRRCDHDGHLLYVGKSSKIALGRICNMMK